MRHGLMFALVLFSARASAEIASFTSETVYVETSSDTGGDGHLDRIYVQVDRPARETSVPTILAVTPYAYGGNDVPNHSASDGATGCVAVASYPAASAAAAIPGNIKSGVTLAGAAGSLTVESHANCASDGEAGCVVVGPAYKAASTAAALARPQGGHAELG